MVDVIQSGDTITRPVSPPPTVHVELPAPTAPADEMLPQGENVVTKRLPGEPIPLSEDGRELRDELRRRKEGGDALIYEWKGAICPFQAGMKAIAGSFEKSARECTLAARQQPQINW